MMRQLIEANFRMNEMIRMNGFKRVSPQWIALKNSWHPTMSGKLGRSIQLKSAGRESQTLSHRSLFSKLDPLYSTLRVIFFKNVLPQFQY